MKQKPHLKFISPNFYGDCSKKLELFKAVKHSSFLVHEHSAIETVAHQNDATIFPEVFRGPWPPP
jgi:hypothetical protein